MGSLKLNSIKIPTELIMYSEYGNQLPENLEYINALKDTNIGILNTDLSESDAIKHVNDLVKTCRANNIPDIITCYNILLHKNKLATEISDFYVFMKNLFNQNLKCTETTNNNTSNHSTHSTTNSASVALDLNQSAGITPASIANGINNASQQPDYKFAAEFVKNSVKFPKGTETTYENLYNIFKMITNAIVGDKLRSMMINREGLKPFTCTFIDDSMCKLTANCYYTGKHIELNYNLKTKECEISFADDNNAEK